MYAPERTTQFLITAPFLMIHPRPTTECSREPSIRHPFDTTEFLESFAGMKPIAITEKILQKKQIEMFNDPLRDFKEHYKNSNGSGKFLVMGVEVKSADQFRELTQMTQERLRKTNNPLELDKAPIYPKK